MENSMQNILDESIEQANRLLESQELLNQAQDMVIENEQVDKATAPNKTYRAWRCFDE